MTTSSFHVYNIYHICSNLSNLIYTWRCWDMTPPRHGNMIITYAWCIHQITTSVTWLKKGLHICYIETRLLHVCSRMWHGVFIHEMYKYIFYIYIYLLLYIYISFPYVTWRLHIRNMQHDSFICLSISFSSSLSLSLTHEHIYACAMACSLFIYETYI